MLQSRNAAYAEESAEVEVLFAEAAKFDNISKRIKASLSRLDVGTQTVRDSIGPVYSNTQGLQTVNDSTKQGKPSSKEANPCELDIDRILEAVDKMLEPSGDKGREERIIRSGCVILQEDIQLRPLNMLIDQARWAFRITCPLSSASIGRWLR